MRTGTGSGDNRRNDEGESGTSSAQRRRQIHDQGEEEEVDRQNGEEAYEGMGGFDFPPNKSEDKGSKGRNRRQTASDEAHVADSSRRHDSAEGNGGARGTASFRKRFQGNKTFCDFVHEAPGGDEDYEMIGQVNESKDGVNGSHDEERRVTRNVDAEEDAICHLREEDEEERHLPDEGVTTDEPTPSLHRQKTIKVDVYERLDQMTSAKAGQRVDVDASSPSSSRLILEGGREDEEEDEREEEEEEVDEAEGGFDSEETERKSEGDCENDDEARVLLVEKAGENHAADF